MMVILDQEIYTSSLFLGLVTCEPSKLNNWYKRAVCVCACILVYSDGAVVPQLKQKRMYQESRVVFCLLPFTFHRLTDLGECISSTCISRCAAANLHHLQRDILKDKFHRARK